MKAVHTSTLPELLQFRPPSTMNAGIHVHGLEDHDDVPFRPWVPSGLETFQVMGQCS